MAKKYKGYNPATDSTFSKSDGQAGRSRATYRSNAPKIIQDVRIGPNPQIIGNHRFVRRIEAADGLIAYYPMNQLSGSTALDYNNGQTPATISGVTQDQPGFIGPSFDFNGTSGYLQAPDKELTRIETGNTWSACFLVNLDSFNNNVLPRFFEKRSLFMCFMGDSGNGKYRRVAIEVTNSTGTGNVNGGSSEFWGSTQLETGQWYFVVGTFDGNLVGTEPSVYQGKIYINGVLETMDIIFDWPTAPNDQLQSTSGFDLFIGRRRTDQARNLDGKMQHFALFDRVLTPDEITELATLAGF